MNFRIKLSKHIYFDRKYGAYWVKTPRKECKAIIVPKYNQRIAPTPFWKKELPIRERNDPFFVGTSRSLFEK